MRKTLSVVLGAAGLLLVAGVLRAGDQVIVCATPELAPTLKALNNME